MSRRPKIAADSMPSWAAMYNAISGALGGTSKNLQLVTPQTLWNWPANNPGQTASQQQSFLDSMPVWSPVGTYQSGSSFSDAYQTWLNSLVVQAPSKLQNQITIQQSVLKTATNQYQIDLSAAQAAYTADKTVVNNNPDFQAWLNGNGFSYGVTLQGDRANVLEQQRILNQLISQAADPMIDEAQAAMSNQQYYTQVVSSTLAAPVAQPGYGQITSYSDWLTQQAGTNPTTITFRTAQATTKFEKDWAEGGAGLFDDFFGIFAEGNWERTTDLETSSDVQVSITMNPMGTIPVSPLPWYQESIIRAKLNNPDAYRPGYTPTKPASGEGAWVLGDGGIMPCRMTDFIVCYQPSFTITTQSGFSQSDYQKIEAAAGVEIGPFFFGGEGGTESSYKRTELSKNTFSGKSTSQFPMLIGIFVEVFR